MVGANTFRNPGLTAKLATTLDHVSDGRAVLGIGGAWFEREHEAFGIDFGASPGERLDWLDESVMLMRRLLDGERVDHDGPRYTLHDALCEPRPVQAAPADPHRRRRAAQDAADGRRAGRRLEHLRVDWRRSATPSRPSSGTAPSVGRDIATIETDGQLPDRHPRRRGSAAEAAMDELLRHNGVAGHGRRCRTWPGRRSEVADAIRPYRDLGFSTVIVRMPAPYDHETIERIGEVAALLDG